MKTGLELIAEERQHQIESGFDKRHDEFESAFQLSSAAALYIANAQNKEFEDHTHYDEKGDVARFQIREIETKKWGNAWPWDDRDDRKDSDVMTSLVKAGALIAAEIDRLQNL